MPYITQDRRKLIDNGLKPETTGELNYAITKLIDQFIVDAGGVRYAHINEIIGVLECAKLEAYRRIAAPYEDVKLLESGDVYKSNDMPNK